MSKLTWEPVLNGDVYCSSACGFKCKKSAYDAAVAEARGLAAGLGEGWEPEVWENMGWHFRAVVPGETRIAVHPGGVRVERVKPGAREVTHRSWTAFLHHMWTGSGPTPQAALREALLKADADQRALNDAYAALAPIRLGLGVASEEKEH